MSNLDITTEMTKEYNDNVFKHLMDSSGIFGDNHTSQTHRKYIVGTNAIIVKWNGLLCPFLTGVGGCCLNIFDFNKDGWLAISRNSIGPFMSDDEARKLEVNLGFY